MRLTEINLDWKKQTAYLFIDKDGKATEEEEKVHRIRITLTSKNVAPLEKVSQRVKKSHEMSELQI